MNEQLLSFQYTGKSLAYAEYGNPDGYPILIQHGLIASIKDSHLFHCLIEAGMHLINIARPGYGESDPYPMKNVGEWGEIVSVLVDELGLAEFDVLGISSGAPYSYAIGYALADRVRNLFILSGIPAMYDKTVLTYWPYPVKWNASIAELQKLAYELFFSHLSQEDRGKDEIKDSLMNDCFGIAQDLKIRSLDWGFRLEDVNSRVTMRHSQSDDSVPFVTAQITSKMLPNCHLDIRENDIHFSLEVLDDFLRTVICVSSAYTTLDRQAP